MTLKEIRDKISATKSELRTAGEVLPNAATEEQRAERRHAGSSGSNAEEAELKHRPRSGTSSKSGSPGSTRDRSLDRRRPSGTDARELRGRRPRYPRARDSRLDPGVHRRPSAGPES